MANVSSSNSLYKCPQLRFPEYNQDWQYHHLQDCADSLRERGEISKSKFVSTENMLQNCEGIEPYTDNNLVSGIKFAENDILLANIRPYLKKLWKATFNGVCSADVVAFHPHIISADFLYYILSNDKFFTYVMSGVKGSKMPRGDKQHIMAYKFFMPTTSEQNKISEFLDLLTLKIKKQQELLIALKSYKRGLKSRLFDKTSNDWNTVKLSEILCERKTYCEKDGTYPHATLSKDGVSAKTERYDRDYLVASDDKKYKITHYGDICYNPANLKFGVICLNTFGSAIFSPIYITFEVTPNYDTVFIGECLTRADFINKALQYQQGTVYERMAVSPEDLLTMEIKVPSLAKQKQIAKCLKSFDTLIAKHESTLSNLLSLKTTLLQQLLI